MNKLQNSLYILLLLLTSCAYEPILKKKNYDFSLAVEIVEGDKNINNLIKQNLENIKGSGKNLKISMDSKIEKSVISKDSKGDPSILGLSVIVNYKVKDADNIIIEDTLNNNTNYNNISDKFELKNYENILIKNLSDRISENIISFIATSLR